MKRQVRAAVFWSVVTFVGGLFLILAAPKLVGGQSMPVLSDSMTPAVKTGDEVIVLPVQAERLRPGDIAVFNDPDRPSRLLNHRVQSLTEREGAIRVVTMGDANSKPELWSVPTGAEVGRVVARIPKVGYLLGHLGSRQVLIWVLVVPALLLCGWLLVTIWRLPEADSEPEPGP